MPDNIVDDSAEVISKLFVCSTVWSALEYNVSVSLFLICYAMANLLILILCRNRHASLTSACPFRRGGIREALEERYVQCRSNT